MAYKNKRKTCGSKHPFRVPDVFCWSKTHDDTEAHWAFVNGRKITWRD